MEEYRCLHCPEITKDFNAIINHNIFYHEEEILRIKIIEPPKGTCTSQMKVITKNFQILPKEFKVKNKLITPNGESKTIKISNMPEYVLSPDKKIAKMSTPLQNNTSFEDLEDNEHNLSASFEDMILGKNSVGSQTNNCFVLETSSIIDETSEHMIHDIVEKIPKVMDYLKSSNKQELYLKFTTLLAERRLPMSNIAFLLFADVVEWFSQDTTCQMRYSDEVKQFWHIGLKLFKGKFLRFMSGWKNKGQNTKGNIRPELSSINFAVPSRSCLEDSFLSEQLRNVKPGVLDDMIKLVNENDCNKTRSFKLCVDGKKINVGIGKQKHGDVNLWGFEGPPNLAQREEDLTKDLEVIKHLSTIVEKLDLKDIPNIGEETTSVNEELVTSGISVIHMLSGRIQELRTVKQKKVMTLERLKSACTNELMKSKYSYAFSAIKTFIYQINVCITRLLKAVDVLGKMVSLCSGVMEMYRSGSTCDLSVQENYVCLSGPETNTGTEINTSMVKQRSTVWHDIRNTAKVTGSTCHAAIGLSGLRKQKEHYESVFCANEKPEPSEDTKTRMKHGVDNEIHAVATLVSKIIPVYYPRAVYAEEGCEVIKHNGETFVVVSPDGSIRQNIRSSITDNTVLSAVEIKCPFPGKIFTTPVYYTIPWYYVSQILMEMHVLGTQSLVFLCYSEESTTVFEAPFDSDLWEEISSRVMNSYGQMNPAMIKRLPEGTSKLIQQIKMYCKEKVKFIAEVPSVKAIRKCMHLDTSSNTVDIGHHTHFPIAADRLDVLTKCTVSEMLTDLHEMTETVNDSYSLGRHLASEVLIFLISDLDRIHERERQHAVPIAYALKGYSLTSSVMRQMLDQVLTKCFEIGLYVPAVSFDGQWSKLAVRARSGIPLTMLQLHKDVYKESKKASKKEIVDVIKKSNAVEAKTLAEVIDQTQCVVKLNFENLFESSLHLYRSNNCVHMFATSPSVRKMLNSNELNQHRRNMNQTVRDDTIRDALLDNLTPEIVDTLQDDILQEINAVTVTETIPTTQTLTIDIGQLFECDEDDLVLDKHLDNTMMEVETMTCSNTSDTFQHIREEEHEQMDCTDDISVDDHIHTKQNKPGEGFLTYSDKDAMLESLRSNPKVTSAKWTGIEVAQFCKKFESQETIKKCFTKHELQVCAKTIADKLKLEKIVFASSWNKDKIAGFMYMLFSDQMDNVAKKPLSKMRRKVRNVCSLKKMCVREINKFNKTVLSCIYAEYLFPKKLQQWRDMSPFASETQIEGIEKPIMWYSMPEYVEETFTYLYEMLDCHHLFVNARVKCCSSGLIECGIKKEAWFKVAEKSSENGSGLSLAVVKDLVDKQSNAFAQKTFSQEVEKVMRDNGDVNEAEFCSMIREWYAAEDEPGIDVIERIQRRLRFRDWLLRDVHFDKFPALGSHIKGIPHIMFEGIVTNIERRIQIIPFVKSGTYNPRALGSLEAENFFGEFQDLDPKGSGVIRPDDIPKAISTACELIGTRLNPDRKFFMHTSQAKMYPAHQLLQQSDNVDHIIAPELYITPNYVTTIHPRNHSFDEQLRAKRKSGKRKCGEISKPSMTSRGLRPIREHHRCDESKVLPHIRLGISLPEDSYS